MKIFVQDFEAVKKVVLELAPGSITCIAGANNQGKSAFIRAIEAFYRNRSGTEFIREGASSSRVGFKDNGKKIVWTKTQTTANYQIGSEKEESLGRKSLYEIDPSTNFVVEKGVSPPLIPNLTHEKTKIFPFNLTPTDAFKVFNRFLGAPKLEIILKDRKDRMKEVKSQLKVTEGVIKTLDSQIISYEQTKARFPDLTRLIELKKQISEDGVALDSLDLSYKTLESKSISYSTLLSVKQGLKENISRFAKIFDGIPEVVAEIEKLKPTLALISEAYSKYDLVKKELETLGSPVTINAKEQDFELLTLMEETEQKINLHEVGTEELALLQTEIERDARELAKFTNCPLCGGEI